MFCEGQTEQAFCRQVLQPHLFPDGDGLIQTLAVGQKDNHHVYGLGRRGCYDRLRKFILNTIKSRSKPNVHFTTFLDLYAIPSDFPCINDHVRNATDPTPFVQSLEIAFAADINSPRFLPHVQLHEFETVLFADPGAFAIAFENCDEQILRLKSIADEFPSIEHINDGRTTAPSKRIIGIIPEYDGRKASAGPDIAEFIGLPAIRQKCPHFDAWLSRLETLPWESTL
jgi:hypothetical protein